MIRLCLHGSAGRMGSQVLRVLPEFPDFSLTCALEKQGSARIGAEVAPGVAISCDLPEALARCDVVIDFSTPEASLSLAEGCASGRKPLLIGTTGHSAEQLAAIRKLAGKTALLLVSNTSPGMIAMRRLCAQAKSMLGSGYDVEIVELHHRFKQDAPSGTALSLARELDPEVSAQLIFSRAERRSARTKDELGVASLRGGDVCGEHSVFFLGDGERLQISHQVSDRAIFARGALRLARELLKKGPGFYSVSDLLMS